MKNLFSARYPTDPTQFIREIREGCGQHPTAPPAPPLPFPRANRSCIAVLIQTVFFPWIALPLCAQPDCPEWEDRHSHFIEVSPGDDLTAAVRRAEPGTTLLLAPGIYRIEETLHFQRDNVTLRSKTGVRSDVILDGNRGGTPLQSDDFLTTIIAVSASHVTLADFTVRYARHHAIHAYPPPDRGITDLRMRNLHIHDCSQQQIKVNSNGGSPPQWVDRGILECSLVEFLDNSVMERQDTHYYTGGIDVHGGLDWVVRNNTFRNIQRDGVLMEHAVHFWNKSRGTVIENNRFEDNYRAIGLGMRTDAYIHERRYPDGQGDDPYVDHIGGLIRNNVIFNRKDIPLESGIEIQNATRVEIYNNTVYSVDPPFSSLEYRWPNTTVTSKNNRLSHRIVIRDGAKATVSEGNTEIAPSALFENAANGDLRLKKAR